MPHNYSSLSPIDFERLCTDLLGAELGVRFESFAEGADGGIDMRAQTPDGVIIGQAKRYKDRAALSGAVRKELAKVARLQPWRYYLLTSCPLSPSNKDEYRALLAPHCRDAAIVLGEEDLDAALKRHPEVLRRHFKLWLQDAAQLSSILHNRLHQLSQARLAELIEDLASFAVPEQAKHLLDQLAQHHVCLITGDAGTGKTTLCGYLALQLAAHEQYDVHVLRDTSGIQQAWDLLQPGRKQCFILDDFFGATFLDTREALALEQALVSLLRKASQGDGHLKLLIASRDYVLRQASERLPNLAGWFTQRIPAFAIDHRSSSLRFKAEILHNLLHFSDLTANQRQQFAKSDRYWRIIMHAHFNPRLLKHLLQQGCRQPAEGLGEGFAEWLLSQLDEPSEYWTQTFVRLSQAAQCLLYTLALSGAELEASDLRGAYAALYRSMHGALSAPGSLQAALNELEPAMLRTHSTQAYTWTGFANPGITDLAQRMLAQHPGLLVAAIDTLCFFEQARHLLALHHAPEQVIALRTAELERLLNRMENLIGEASLQRMEDSDAVWQAKEGQHVADYWQTLLEIPTPGSLKSYPELRQRMLDRAKAADWAAWYRHGRYQPLLQLACTALSADALANALDVAMDSIQNSEDAVALTEALSSQPALREYLAGSIGTLKKKIRRIYAEEIEQAEDEYHLGAILEDIEFIADELHMNLSDVKSQAWRKLEKASCAFGQTTPVTEIPEALRVAFLDHEAERRYVERLFEAR